MARTYNGAFLSVSTVGFSAVTGAASARTAIPVNGAGVVPTFIRVAARNECYIRVGDSSVAATSSGMLIQPGDSVLLSVGRGDTHIAYIQGTAAGQINVTPLDNA
jgi:hypothetical protein